METILVEVLLEELANGGRRADNGWRKDSLKCTADEINSRLGMNLVSDNRRGNTGFDDMETDSGDNIEETQGGGGDAPKVAESEADGAATSQTESVQNTTTPTAKKSRKSRFFEDIPKPLSFKVFTDAVVELAKALKPPEPVPVVVAPKPIELLKDVLHSLPDMNPELYLRSLDLLAVDLPLMEVFLGLEEDIKAGWLFRKLHQAGL
ncbi:hypothetical protein IFM89_027363 [Coptis chinensis]|uniref:Uncharacterized protein n=1 Tax=Coptis chinensis TaxID=261450 RepID=A0A835IGF0_9MAGN|nr:hypothetical protein IFM89_027363 [Coptis chinensis]